MTIFRPMSAIALAVAFLSQIASAQPAPDPAAPEFDALQVRLQALASTFTTATETKDVNTILAIDAEWAVDQPCSSICTRWFSAGAGKTIPYSLDLYQYAFSYNSDNYHYDRAFKSDKSILAVRLSDKAPATACLSETDWNTALVDKGWQPLKPFSLKKSVEVGIAGTYDAYGFPGQTKKVDLTMTGYATRKGDMYLSLSNASGGEAIVHLILQDKDIDRLQTTDACLREVDIGGPFEPDAHGPYEKDAYTAAETSK